MTSVLSLSTYPIQEGINLPYYERAIYIFGDTHIYISNGADMIL